MLLQLEIPMADSKLKARPLPGGGYTLSYEGWDVSATGETYPAAYAQLKHAMEWRLMKSLMDGKDFAVEAVMVG